MKQMYERPRPLRDLNLQIPLALEDIVLQAMEKEASKRYQQPEDLRQALLQATHVNDSIVTVSAWPTVEHSAFRRQRSGEQQPLVVSSTPVTPSARTYDEAQHSTPATPSESPHFYAQSNPVNSTPITTGEKLVPMHKRRGSASFRGNQGARKGNAPPIHARPCDARSYGRGVPLAGALAPFQPNSPQWTETQRRSPFALVVVGLLVAFFLLGGLGTALLAPQIFGRGGGISMAPVTGKPGSAHINQTLITQNVPSTTTTCPNVGTARAAVLAPLVLGSHQNLVYIVNEFNPLQGTVKRREVNATHGVEIVKMPNVTLSEAQISQDGQWVLFTAHVARQDQLRLVRVDGQGLQTLYCTPIDSSIFGSQWSFNQQSVVFDTGPNGQGQTIMLLNVQSGDVQPELVPQGKFSYVPRTWLDATHVYLNSFSAAIPRNLYLLDTQKGAKQHDSDLQQVLSSTQTCTSFDTSYDVKSLYLSTCSSNGNVATSFNGPSSITIQDTKGGNARTIFTSQTLAITMVRAISQTTLLLMVGNIAGDTSQNGLWEMNTDGTGLTRLSIDTAHTQSLCQFSQYAWSNVSLDHSLYALQSYQPDSHTYGMYYGSLNGGDPNQFAGISDGTQLFLAGWTQL